MEKVFISMCRVPSFFNRDKYREMITIGNERFYLANHQDINPKARYTKRHLESVETGEKITLLS